MTAAEVAKQRFREFSAHMRESGHRDAKVCRSYELRRMSLVCWECKESWVFTDVAMRGSPHILEYLRSCGFVEEVEAILRGDPTPGAWKTIYFGFLAT